MSRAMIKAVRALRCRPAGSWLGTRQDATWATILTPAALVGALVYLQRDTTEKVASVPRSVEKSIERLEKSNERIEKSNVEAFKSFETSLTKELDLKFTHALERSDHIATKAALDTTTKVL